MISTVTTLRFRYRLIGAAIALIGVAFIIAALSDIFIPGGYGVAGDVLVIAGLVLLFSEFRTMNTEERRGVVYAVLMYSFAALVSFLSSRSLPFALPLLSLYSTASSLSLAVPPPSLFSAMAVSMVVYTLVYVSFFLLIHRISLAEHRSMLWIALVGGLFISIAVIPSGIILNFYDIGVVSSVLPVLQGVVNLIYGIAYVLTGIYIRG
ncbi:MAG: hypothetical protein KIY12_03255 [Thermoplasmata archaeon]|uniref:Uncharacterized protein n=1 Tax=Candidatus Sysuiplasma superficiale TaxID=2823368 RepID=A0A8J7YR85_9ARCH|nr:hypothetical protein [Candidatus Sysuiplasma superficiale]MBX8643726.1 hypothetical protein [Candidatus Sysuiplasma superficiale]MCL4347370.1 hypothetical protein [Candidatus Thermoplasmatota archaeon]